MKIVICNTFYPPDGIGGPERSVKITAEHLVRRGHEVTVIGQGFHRDDRTYEIDGVKRISIGCPPGYQPVIADRRGMIRDLKKKVFKRFSFDLSKKYMDLIAAEAPDVVQTNVVHAVDRLWHLVSEQHIPVVHTLRIYNVMCNERMYFQGAECRYQCPPCRAKFAGRIPRSNRVSGVVGISRYVLQRHLDEGFFSRCPLKFVIGNPYDLDPKTVPERNPQRDRRPRFLFMGRIHPSKGIRLFCDLARRTPADQADFRICGEGHADYEREIRQQLGDRPVEWMGFVPHEKAFAEVDWMITPSLWGEPFGRVVIEAFAHGVPVVATNRGAFPELISHGRNGLLFEPDEPLALAEVAEAILGGEHDLPQMAQESRKSAELYSGERIAAQYESAFERAIEQKNTVVR